MVIKLINNKKLRAVALFCAAARFKITIFETNSTTYVFDRKVKKDTIIVWLH